MSQAEVDDRTVREWEEVGITLALEAGQVMMAATARGVNKRTECKESAVDLVTEADQEIEKLLFSRIADKYPDHRTIGEESTSAAAAAAAHSNPPAAGSAGGAAAAAAAADDDDDASGNKWTDAVTWIIDPIDGTMNFVHTFPLSCVSIGVTHKKRTVLGIVYNPWIDQLFTARRGQGAYLNGKPIHTSGCRQLKDALLIAELGGSRDPERKEAVCKNVLSLMWECHGLRSLGSAAMNTCSIACGSADAYYEFGLHAWDMCAASLILEEAGGCCIDTQGGPLDLMNRRIIAAASPELAHHISRTLPVHLQLQRD